MEYLIGSLATVVFFALVGAAYILGAKQKKKPQKEEVSAEDRLKQEQLKRDFDSMMNYSVDQAIGGGRR